MEKELNTKLTEATKKEELPISFLTTFISKGWDEVGMLKEEITAIKREFSGTAKVAKLIQDLVDAYLICIGQLELHLHNNDYIDYPEAEDANKLVESLLDTDIEIEEPALGKVNIPDLTIKDTTEKAEDVEDLCVDKPEEEVDSKADDICVKDVENANKICADDININIDDLEININKDSKPEEAAIIEPFEYFCDFPEVSSKDNEENID